MYHFSISDTSDFSERDFHPKPPKQIEITPVRGTNHTRTRNKSHPYSKQTPMAILARYENFYNTLSSFLHKSFIERCPY